MKKKLGLLLAVSAVLLMLFTLTAFAENNEALSGTASESGAEVMLKVLDNSCKKLKYVDKCTADENGKFSFNFPYEVGDNVYVSEDGVCINDDTDGFSSIECIVCREKLNGADNALAFKPMLGATIDGKNLLTAFYDANSNLISVDFHDFADVVVPENAETLSCYTYAGGKFNADKNGEKLGTVSTNISCWGDSLTYGTGSDFEWAKTPYPAVLQELLGDKYAVKNFGVGGEQTATIAGRQNGVPMTVKDGITIPKDKTPTEAFSMGGIAVSPLVQGNGGTNPCYIMGIEGELAFNPDYTYTFTRTEEGEEVVVPAGTEIFTKAGIEHKGDIAIIFAGTNDMGNTVMDFTDAVLDAEGKMVDYIDNDEGYIIVGLTAGNEKDDEALGRYRNLEAKMAEKFGEHYLDLRAYLTDEKTYADNKIELTAEDRELMAQGRMPKSILSDKAHFLKTGYGLIAKCIYQKMIELGFAVQ